METGAAAFLSGLRELGHQPSTLQGKPDHVVIDYEVQSGKFAGKSLKHGFIVPADFPVTPPSGVHIAAWIHPERSGGDHPTGGIHRAAAASFRQAVGGDWQYWSRPPKDWAISKKTASTYMVHVWRLWDSQ
jgi:hypothetical protein